MARTLFAFTCVLAIACMAVVALQAKATQLPDPVLVEAPAAGDQSVVLAGGCFWGVQAVFQHVKGVKEAVSGYAGGTLANPSYQDVSSGSTGHAEAVKVTYDPAQISFNQILKIYFSVVQDPTQLNRQGPDTGTQYRSEIFYTTPTQQKAAAAYIAQLESAKLFDAPIVTKSEKLAAFYPAEDYHQNYYKLNPNAPYIVINDKPKVANLQKLFPALYIDN